MGKQENDTKITLEELLQLKRAEKPSEDFWQSFDHQLESRRLNALIHRPAFNFLHPAFWKKLAWVFTPVSCLLALGLFVQHESPEREAHQQIVSHLPAPLQIQRVPAESEKAAAEAEAGPPASARKQFVTDTLKTNATSPQHFQRILRSSILSPSAGDSARYVNDAFTSQNSTRGEKVKLDLGRHF